MSPELVDIGRDIARKCGGLPLVAMVIGGTMCNERNKEEWESIRDSSLWGSLEKSEGILRVLKLSFHRLPLTSLKQCFVYCSIFPKDFRIQKEQLIRLWMAEGICVPVDEDIGNEYFNRLLSYSLFQDVERDKYGCIMSCKMHDLVHDLAQSISEAKRSSSEITNATHHHSSRGSPNQTVPDHIEAKLWYSLFLKSLARGINLEDFKGLRVLKIGNVAFIRELPDSIGRLKYLRYFDISRTCIHKLPKSTTHLYHLQTLRLLDCSSLEKLPKGMKNLVSLRHLCINRGRHVPHEIGCLTSLRTLPIFEVGTKMGCRIQELGYLRELGGALVIYCLENVRNKQEAMGAKLCEKRRLDMLDYNWRDDSRENSRNDEEVLEGLEPHSNLKRLTIWSYSGERYPSWLGRRSTVSGSTASFEPANLVELVLSNCKNLQNFPTGLRPFPKLKFLKIEGLPNLRCIGNETIMLFPELEVFTLGHMEQLEEWLEVFSSLKELGIRRCNKLRRVPIMSRFASLEKISIRSCKGLSWTEDGLFRSGLKILDIEGCTNLKSLPSAEGGISLLQNISVRHCDELSKIEEGLLASACLRDVVIAYCPKLTSVSFNSGYPSLLNLELYDCRELWEIEGGLQLQKLETLSIENCANLISFPSTDGFSSLSKLKIVGNERLTSLPSAFSSGINTSLVNLSISGFAHLKSIPEDAGQLHFLTSLKISNCRNVTRFPEEILGNLTRLKTLELGPFSEELEEFPGLTSIHSSLQQLTLHGWEKLNSLPHQLQHLTSLEELAVRKFKGVTSLPEWLGNLSSLRELYIWYSENLKHLPSEEAMQRLSNLQRLSIRRCPLLKAACAKSGSERSKISHIPKIYIDELEKTFDHLETNVAAPFRLNCLI